MPREARSVQTDAGDRHREARPREARSVQTDAGDRHREARPREARSVQTDAGDRHREARPREARSVQTDTGDRHREAKPREARYVQTDAGDRHREAKENTGRGIESQPVSDEDPTGQKTSSRGPIKEIGERSSIEVNSAGGVISTRALIEFSEKRRKLIIRPSKPLSKDGVRMFFMKGISNGIIILKTYYKAVNNPVYGWWWLEAIETKLLVLALYNVWELVDLLNNKKSIGCKWVFTMKVDLKGRITKFKARLIVKEYK